MRRALPLFILVIGLCAFFLLGGKQYLSLEFLKKHYQLILNWSNNHYLLAPLLCISIYATFVAISAPGAVFLTLISGMLFGPVWGSIYVTVGATIGATLIFSAVKLSISTFDKSKLAGWIKRLEQGFQDNAFFYLLTLRLIPAFPFFIVNIVPALLNMPLMKYMSATFVGIIPGVIIYTTLGSNLHDILNNDTSPNLNIIFQPKVLLPLLALAILSLLPTLYRRSRS